MDGHKVAAALGDRIGHVHGKDTVFHPESLALNGLLDRRWPEPAAEMPWTFAVPGRGHDLAWWTGLVRTLGGSAAGLRMIEKGARLGDTGLITLPHAAKLKDGRNPAVREGNLITKSKSIQPSPPSPPPPQPGCPSGNPGSGF